MVSEHGRSFLVRPFIGGHDGPANRSDGCTIPGRAAARPPDRGPPGRAPASGAYWTTMVAVMLGWIAQWYVYVPAVVNVSLNELPFESRLLSNVPSSAVTV